MASDHLRRARQAACALLSALTPLLVAGGLCLQSARLVAQVHPADDEQVEAIRSLLREARYADAEARARELVSSRESQHGESLPLARAIDALVQALVDGGKAANPEALERATRAVAMKEALVGREHSEVGASLANLGLVLRRRGNMADARGAYERSLSIREQTLGPNHPEVARTLAALSALANNEGEFARSRELGTRAIAIAERATPPDPVLEAVAANNLALACYQLGEHLEAKRWLERALRSYEGALGPDHPEVAKTLSNLANVLGDWGDLTGARARYERAVQIQERRQGVDHPDVALTLNNLADILYVLGDHRAAHALFERVLRMLEAAFGAKHTRVAMALGNLAGVRTAMGQLEGARPLYERALRIREESLGPDHPSLVYTIAGSANLRARLGEHESAREMYLRALSIAERSLGRDHPLVAMTLQGLGEASVALGDLVGARTHLARALAIRRQILGDDHPSVAETRAAIALAMARSGDATAALDAALEAERVAREHLRITAQALPERQALAYARERVSGADIALTLVERELRTTPSAVQRVWDAIVGSRAIILDEMALRQRLVNDAADADIARLAAGLTSARERLAGLLARSAGDPPVRQRVEDAVRERDAAERALVERSLEFRAQREGVATGLEQARAALPATGALVGFVRFRRDPGAEEKQATHGERSGERSTRFAYLAFVARGDGSAPVAVPLGDAAAIDTAVSRWRAAIADEAEAGRSTAAAERFYRRTGTELRRLVWDPVRPVLGSATQVFIVPAGPLHLVNWAALPGEGGRYLVEEEPVIHYLSSERDLVSRETAFGTGLLVVDNPSYGRRVGQAGSRASLSRMPASIEQPAPAAVPGPKNGGCRDLRGVQFEALPGTSREAGELVAVWSSLDSPVMRLSGARATEENVKRSVRGRRVVHLATHGFFLGAWCHDADAPAEQPLLLAGLAFADANLRASATADGEDGLLMAEEIAPLDLHGVEWVVLSACDTGVGIVGAAEELLGLRRVFQIAGAHTVIVSLWPVSDHTTREWMTAAYRSHFAAGTGTAIAVRDAARALIASRRAKGQSAHPAHWASFVAIGGW